MDRGNGRSVDDLDRDAWQCRRRTQQPASCHSDVVNAIVSILSGLFLLYVSYAGYKLSVAAQFKVTDVLRVSYYWIDIAVPVGFVIIALYMFAGAFKSLRAAFAGGKA